VWYDFLITKEKREFVMDKLVEFLTSKIGYTVAVIVGFLFPGMLFIFIWNREVYLELGLVRLIILALGIAFAIYILHFLLVGFTCFVQEKAGDREADLGYIIGMPLLITNIEIYYAMIYKLEHNNFTITQFVDVVIGFAELLAIVGIIPSAIKIAWKKIRRKK